MSDSIMVIQEYKDIHYFEMNYGMLWFKSFTELFIFWIFENGYNIETLDMSIAAKFYTAFNIK